MGQHSTNTALHLTAVIYKRTWYLFNCKSGEHHY